MKRRFNLTLWLLGLGVVVCAPRAVAEEPPPVIKIATLNSEFLVKSKVHIKFGLPFTLSDADAAAWNAAGFRDARLKEASQAVAKVIKKLDADVIALCEVGDEADVEVLRSEVALLGLDYPNIAVCDSTDRTTGQHVAVLSKHPFEQIIRQIAGRESYYGELDDPESESDTGISKGLHVMFKARNKRINVFVLHLSSERGGHEQDEQRIAQASIARRTYLPRLNDGEHVVVLGDLNDYRGQPTLRRLRGLDDIYPDLIQTGGPVFNRQRSNESSQDYNARIGEHYTFQFDGQKNQIDHILISQSIRSVCKPGGVRIAFVDANEKIGSTEHLATDHRAVMLELELK
ncbi:MAG: endonuclease/exonuclease/phosphatase family protein [Planctomycetota bacterium]